jgi:hypothetical protein
MLITKSAVTAAMRAQGHHDRAQQAECSLPRRIDTDRDAGLLHKFDVNLADVMVRGTPHL